MKILKIVKVCTDFVGWSLEALPPRHQEELYSDIDYRLVVG